MNAFPALIAFVAIALSGPAAARAEEPLVAGENGVPVPKKTKTILPSYPPEAQARGQRGIVIVELVIDTQGKVSSAQVIRSIPPFDEAALTAVRQWEYEVTRVGGKPVSVKLTVPITFAMKVPEITSRQEGIPELRAGAFPPFPSDSKEQASATAELTLSPDGAVEELRIVDGPPAFTDALARALRTWRFAPDSGEATVTFRVLAQFVPAARGAASRIEFRLNGLRRSEPLEAADADTPSEAPGAAPAPVAPTAAAPVAAAPSPTAVAPPEPPGAPPSSAPTGPAPGAPAPAPPAAAGAAPDVARPAPKPATAEATPDSSAAPSGSPGPAPASPSTVSPPAVAPATAAAATPAVATTPPPAATAPPGAESHPPAVAPTATSAQAIPKPPAMEVLSVGPPPEPPENGLSAIRDVALAPGVPDLTRGRRPVPPPLARMAQATGTVEVAFSVDAAGIAAVKGSTGPDIFKRAAEQAVASWTFRRTRADRIFLLAEFKYGLDTASAAVRPDVK